MGQLKSPFENPTLNWIDSRLPLLRVVRHVGLEHAYPKNLTYWWNFGSIAGVMLGIMIVTGLLLAINFVPDASQDKYGYNDAFSSVDRIMREVGGGDVLRYLHMNGASFFFIAVYFHMFRGLYYGSYKAPREILWILGVVILVLMMGIAFMGYSMVWGAMSFAGAQVIAEIFTVIPLIGGDVKTLLLGSFTVDDPTLNRFFTLHFLLPFVLAGVVILHMTTLLTVGSNNPLGIDLKSKKDTVSFHPYYTFKDIFGLAAFMTIYLFVTFFMPEMLGEAINNDPANNLATPEHIVPEWYFLWAFAILRAIVFDIGIPFTDIVIPAKTLGGFAMIGAIAILFLLPWLDRSPVRSGRFRPLFQWFFWAFVVNIVLLTLAGVQSATAPFHVIFFDLPFFEVDLGFIQFNTDTGFYSLLSTGYYFAYFILVLPLLPLIEKTKPLPNSIAEPVLREESAA